MQLQPYVDDVQTQLTAAAGLGDERTRETAAALAAAAAPAVRLAVLQAVSAAADEITAVLLDAPGSPTVSARLDGEDVRVEVQRAPVAEPQLEQAAAVDDGDTSARISLRLPESLKGQVEVAARASGVSVNSWLVRAASAALRGPATSTAPTSGHRLTGWVNR